MPNPLACNSCSAKDCMPEFIKDACERYGEGVYVFDCVLCGQEKTITHIRHIISNLPPIHYRPINMTFMRDADAEECIKEFANAPPI